jgi:transcriptional regulator with XRE-family HTH domain
MRSTDTPPTPAERFGAWFRAQAERCGYDLSPRGGGRAALAAATGMSASSIGRTIEGKTLPMPSQFEVIANLFDVPVRDVLVEAGIISAESWTESPGDPVRSQSFPLEQQLEQLGVTDPKLRAMLLANVEQAIHLSSQERTERGGTAHG